MTYQEGEMKILQDFLRKDSWILRLVDRFGSAHTVGGIVGAAVHIPMLRPDATFLPRASRSNSWRCSIGRHEVESHILDKKALALQMGKYAIEACLRNLYRCSDRYESCLRGKTMRTGSFLFASAREGE